MVHFFLRCAERCIVTSWPSMAEHLAQQLQVAQEKHDSALRTVAMLLAANQADYLTIGALNEPFFVGNGPLDFVRSWARLGGALFHAGASQAHVFCGRTREDPLIGLKLCHIALNAPSQRI